MISLLNITIISFMVITSIFRSIVRKKRYVKKNEVI
nr:MAG TPA: hypothetical protein [Caudoviricetes sp.]